MEEETVLDCVILGTTISYPARPNETVSMVSTRVYDEYRQLLRYKKPMRVKVLITLPIYSPLMRIHVLINYHPFIVCTRSSNWSLIK